MEKLPLSLIIGFMLITFLTVFIFYLAANKSKTVLLLLTVWLALQAAVGIPGFYTNTHSLPPRFILLLLPPLIFIIFLFATKKGQLFIDGLHVKILVLLHIVRIPVEVILWGLYIHKTIPELMTFEGRNFDIAAGLTAPFIYYFGCVKNKIPAGIIQAWNFICLVLLLNIVINAILSAPSGFQQFAFDQPNIAILYFPFVWLPCCIVPLVLLSHLVVIKNWRKKNTLKAVSL